jgi:DNA-binding MarR family transcriptional regulator
VQARAGQIAAETLLYNGAGRAYLPRQPLPEQAMPAYTVDSFEPDRSVGYLVKRIHAEVIAALEPLFDPLDLTFTQWSALVSVHYGRGGTCAALARELGHDIGATSRLIATLEERGLLTRERSTEDRRVQHIQLTAEGAELAARRRELLVTQWNRWLDGWTRDEVDALVGGLQRLRATLEAERAA